MPRQRGFIRPLHNKTGLVQRLLDAAWIVLAHALAFWVYDSAGEWDNHHTVATGGALLVFLFLAEAGGLYRAWRGVPLHKELVRVWAVWGGVLTALLLAAFFTKESSTFSRVATLGWFIGAPTLISVGRGLLRLALQEARKRGRNMRRAGVIGMTEMGERVAAHLAETPWLGMEMVGFFDDRTPERLHTPEADLPDLVGTFDDAVRKAREGEIDILYIALPMRAEPRVQKLLRDLADTTASVYVVPDFFVFDLLHGRWSALDDIPVVSVFETSFYGIDGWVKRFEDIVLGTVFLTIAALPMALIALLIKLTSKGPVFFQQRRYGLDGEIIHVLKFRSMTVAEDGAKVKQAEKNDSRITPVGAILRRLSLDELPQLFHVVTGSMSLVGPRPHAVAHNEAYRKRIHGYMLRHKVKPGLTGWAQVNGWRGETDTLEKMEKRVEHDLEYIRRWGLWFDLKIILLTVFSPKVHRNAY